MCVNEYLRNSFTSEDKNVNVLSFSAAHTDRDVTEIGNLRSDDVILEDEDSPEVIHCRKTRGHHRS